MNFALTTLWHDRQRYLPGVLAVAFSAVLIALQCGLLIGLLSVTALPIDRSRAEIWVGSPDVLSVDLGRGIPENFLSRLAENPEVERIENFYQGFTYWSKSGRSQLCIVIGSNLENDALGAVDALTPELRVALTEPDTIVIDESERGRLGLTEGVEMTGEIGGRKVRVVGLIKGFKSLAGPYIFCSQSTAKPLVPRLQPDQTVYLIAKCRHPEDAPAVVERLKLKHYEDMSAFTSGEFSRRSQLHWLTTTGAGIALGYTALLGLMVGAVVTSQTLYAATVGALREYAVLRALGIPRWRMATAVLSQSFWIGVLGLALSVPAVYGLAHVAGLAGARVLLAGWLQGAVAAITLVMAMGSGLFALRSLRLIEPANLLR
jgi:putative ABC transport system permease protein